MKVRGIITEDFVNYKLPSMFILSCYCDWKCCNEQNINIEVCQNAPLYKSNIIDIDNIDIYNTFIKNPISKAIVIGGLEPILQIKEIIDLINLFRTQGEDCPFVIYTGYYPDEIIEELNKLKQYKNIIVKFGRYIINHNSCYDKILGVNLASSNQYAEQIS